MNSKWDIENNLIEHRKHKAEEEKTVDLSRLEENSTHKEKQENTDRRQQEKTIEAKLISYPESIIRS